MTQGAGAFTGAAVASLGFDLSKDLDSKKVTGHWCLAISKATLSTSGRSLAFSGISFLVDLVLKAKEKGNQQNSFFGPPSFQLRNGQRNQKHSGFYTWKSW